MRILIFAYGYGPQSISESLTAAKIVAELRKQHHVTVLTKDPSDEPDVITIPRIDWFKRWALLRPLKLDYWTFMWRAYRYAKRHQDQFDVAHHISPISLRYPNLLSKLKIPFIWGPVGGSIPFPKGFESTFAQESWVKRLRVMDSLRLHHDPLLVDTLRRASAIVATTSAAASLLPREHGEKTWVVPEGVDPGEVREIAQHAPKVGRDIDEIGDYCFTGGRMVPYKAFDYVIKGFAQSEVCRQQGRLVITGDGPERQSLEQLARDLGIESQVIFLGRVNRMQNIRLMARARFCVYPALKEAFGHVNLEAMSLGIPVIATDWGGPHDIIQDGVNGFLISPEGNASFAQMIADKMDALWADEALRQRFGLAALERVKQFTWPSIADRLNVIYDQQLAARGADARKAS